jgi:hypothetical protein
MMWRQKGWGGGVYSKIRNWKCIHSVVMDVK